MAALREVFARFSFGFDGAGKLQEANRGIDRLADAVTAVGAVFTGSAIFTGLKDLAAQLDVYDDLSAQTKLATDSLQTLTYAAEVNGSSTQEMVSALTLFQKALGKTTEATSPQTEALKELNIETKDAAGNQKDLATILPEVLDNFKDLPSDATKAAVATSLFGRAGVRMIPMLNKGAAGLEELRSELEAVGGIIDGETIASAGEFRDHVVRMDRSLFGLKSTLAGAVFPQLSKTIDALSRGVGGLSRWLSQTTLADTATKALGVTLGVTLFKALRPYMGAGLKFGAIFLAVDDLLGFLAGKDSAIGRLLNAAFGAGSADVVRAWVNDAIAEFGRFRDSAAATFAAVENDQLGWRDRALATFVAFFRDASAGFPFLVSSARTHMLVLEQSVNEVVLRLEERWNSFISKLSLPDSVKDALTIDTTDTRTGLAINRDEQLGEISRREMLRAGKDPDALPARRGVTVDAGEEGLTRDQVLQGRASLGDGGAAAALNPGSALFNDGAFSVATGGVPAGIADPARVAAFATVPAQNVTNNAPSLTQQNTFQITTADPREAAREVSRNLGGANRAALTALTQRK